MAPGWPVRSHTCVSRNWSFDGREVASRTANDPPMKCDECGQCLEGAKGFLNEERLGHGLDFQRPAPPDDPLAPNSEKVAKGDAKSLPPPARTEDMARRNLPHLGSGRLAVPWRRTRQPDRRASAHNTSKEVFSLRPKQRRGSSRRLRR